MPVVLPLKKMSRDEKLRAMEALWDEARSESGASWIADAICAGSSCSCGKFEGIAS